MSNWLGWWSDNKLMMSCIFFLPSFFISYPHVCVCVPNVCIFCCSSVSVKWWTGTRNLCMCTFDIIFITKCLIKIAKKKCMTDSVSDCYSRCFVSFSAQNGVVWCDFIVWSGLTHFLQGKPLNVLTSTPVRVLWSDLKGNSFPFLLWYHLPFHSKKIFLLRHISKSIIRIAARHVYTFNITPIQYF